MRFSADHHDATPTPSETATTRRRGVLRAGFAATTTALLAACGSGISLDEPIESRVWRLTRLGSQPVAAGNDPQRDPQIRFDGTRVSGSGGCNRVSGGYQRDGHTLRIGGELLSDALGAAGTPEGTYIGMVRHNAHAISSALGGLK